MADKTQNVKTRLSFDGEAEYKAACKEINSTLKVLNSEMKLVTAGQCKQRRCAESKADGTTEDIRRAGKKGKRNRGGFRKMSQGNRRQ